MDTSSWKWFRYDEIFDIKHGFYNKKPEDDPDGDIPFIGATDSNNGVTSYSNLETIAVTTKTGDGNNAPMEEKIFENCIAVTNNGSVGYAYYQAKPFTCTHDVNPLYLKEHELTPYIALFLCTIIEKERFRWAYGRKWRPIRMPSSKIKLPVNSEGLPDWQYMEDFVKDRIIPQLPRKAQKVWLQKYNTKPLKQEKMKLNTDEWKWFELKDLFSVTRGERLTIPDRGVGVIPFVTAGEGNTGVSTFISNDVDKYSNAITIDMFGYAFYREYEFACDDNILVLQNSNINRYNGVFVATIISKDRYRCAYGRQYRQKTFEKHKIKLPVTPFGDPDWQFMEDYIKSMPYSKNLEPSKPDEKVDELMEIKKRVIEMERKMETINGAATVNIIGSNVTYLDQSKNYSIEK